MQHRTLALILVLASCFPKPPSGDSDGSSSSATDGASGSSDTTPGVTSDTAPTTAPTTGVPMTSGSSATTSASATSSSSGGATGDVDTTGGPIGGLPGACGAVCAHWDMCSPGSVGSLADCKAGCIDGFEDPPECAAAIAAQWECVAGLSCAEALKFIDGEPTSCLAELAAADQACDFGEPCGGEIGGDMETCTLEQQCGDGTQQYDCGPDVCTCIQDDVPGKQCPSNNFCSTSHEEQRAAITACCGWEWQI